MKLCYKIDQTTKYPFITHIKPNQTKPNQTTKMIYHTICIRVLQSITYIENVFPWQIFKYLKIEMLKRLITYEGYIDNDITNIVCTKLDRNKKCERALCKLRERKHDIFRISPRGLVCCVLNTNMDMLYELKKMGYPLEMITWSTNYHLVKKRQLIHVIDGV